MVRIVALVKQKEESSLGKFATINRKENLPLENLQQSIGKLDKRKKFLVFVASNIKVGSGLYQACC